MTSAGTPSGSSPVATIGQETGSTDEGGSILQEDQETEASTDLGDKRETGNDDGLGVLLLVLYGCPRPLSFIPDNEGRSQTTIKTTASQTDTTAESAGNNRDAESY